MPAAKKTTVSANLAEELAKNNVVMQKLVLQLSESMQQTNTKIDRMLTVFEQAALNIEKGEVLKEPLSDRLEALLEQNKAIARGLILIEKYVRDKTTTGFQTLKER